MKIIDVIEKKIEKIPEGQVFTYADFDIEVERKNTVVKTLNILVAKGKITKLSKGKFYKPQVTVSGSCSLSSNQIVKDFLEQDGKIIGYLTGYSIYNDLQINAPNTNIIQIGTNRYRRPLKRCNFNISFVLQPNKITTSNYRLLQILDVLRFVHSIPATTVDEVSKRLKQIFNELKPEELLKITKLALKYTDYVRAFCGAILESIGADMPLLALLHKSLNGITAYKLGISDEVLPTKAQSRIR